MLDEPSFSPDLLFALELADLAEKHSLNEFRTRAFGVKNKADNTPVTDVDTGIEHALRARIAERFPTDGCFGEEEGEKAASENTGIKRRWILDPIDGTANFVRGIPNWATLIALEVNGEIVLGVVAMPALGKRWWAERGGGAWKTHREEISAAYVYTKAERVQVSSTENLSQASFSFQSIQQWEEAGVLAELLHVRRNIWRDRAYGDAWSYTALAEGLVDIVAEFDLKPYDIAAHIPLLQEAGGEITDMNGNPIIFEAGLYDGSVCATNARLHHPFLQSFHNTPRLYGRDSKLVEWSYIRAEGEDR